MKLILKTLKQVQHEIEIDNEDATVKDVKDLTEKKYNFPAETIKLVFNGNVLKDESKLKESNINDGNVIVMMFSKAKVQNKAPVVEEKPQEKNETVTTNTTTTVPTSTTVNNNTVPSSNINTGVNPNPKVAQNTSQNQPDYTNEVNTLVEMGFPKEYSETAIKAAKGNVTLAIEFLYNGIPDNLVNQQNQNSSEPQNVQGQGNEQGEMSSLDIVRRIASIIKVLCANDPTQLQNIIMSLQQTRPELIELIKQHESEFKTIIQSQVTEDDISAFQQFHSELGIEGGSRSTGQSGQEGAQGRDGTIRLTKPEYDAIQRLKEFGFSEMEAAQAYFACDKNEEYALNFLFEMKTQDSGFDGGKKINNKF